jgi:hypothetical protein
LAELELKELAVEDDRKEMARNELGCAEKTFMYAAVTVGLV